MHISSKCSVAIHCLLYINEYGQDAKVTSELLSLSTGCNAVTIRGIMSALKKDGMLTVRPGIGGSTLNCPPEEITLYRICMAVEPTAVARFMGVHTTPSQHCTVGKNIKDVLEIGYAPLREDVAESMKKITLRCFIDEFHEHLTKDE